MSKASIITYVHRPKRSRKRKAQAADMPVIVRAGKKAHVAAANDDCKSAIVTVKNPRRGQFGEVPGITPEEHKRLGDAADALWRELVRRVREE
jgi:hypothetical protein